MEPAPNLIADRCNLADRNALSTDHQSWRILADVDAADGATWVEMATACPLAFVALIEML
jgi:hypothetical protein